MITIKVFKDGMINLLWEFEDYWILKGKEAPDDFPKILSDAEWYEQFIMWINIERSQSEN